MTVHMKDIWKLMDDADHHARAVLRIHTEIRSLLSNISIPEKPEHPCPQCGIALPGERALAFHLYNVHDGPPVPLTDQDLTA